MPTLWQILTEKKQPVETEERKIYNPLNLIIAGDQRSIVQLNTTDLMGTKFVAQRIRNLCRKANGQTYLIADYDLVAKTTCQQCGGKGCPQCSGKPIIVSRILRLVPVVGEASHNAALLSVIDSFAWNQGLYDKLNDIPADRNGGDLHCDDDGTDWWRINDATEPWTASLVTLEDRDGSGRVDPNEVITSSITYWDYWRQSPLNADNGQSPTVELLFFEMSDKKAFEIKRGSEINPQRIDIIA